MDTQDRTPVSDTPATQPQPNTTERDTPTEEHLTDMHELFQSDMFAPEQLRLAI
ncbi:MAG: hypothetical protein AAB555_01045 [Patescibacteria group bacterium]